MNHGDSLRDWTESYLIALITETVGNLRLTLDHTTPFAETGIDSFRILKIIKKLEDDFGRLPKTLLFENINVEQLAAYFVRHHAEVIATRIPADLPRPAQERAATIPEAATAAPPPGAPPASAETLVPLLLLECDALRDPVIGTTIQEIFDSYKNEAGASRGTRHIAPNIFLGSARRGFFNYARCKDTVLAYAYTGPEDYFPVLAQELLAHCTEKKLQLNIFTDRVMDPVGSVRFSSTPFGALQRIVGLGAFTLDGGPMRRLRYQVTKFAKTDAARTEEYRLGTDVGTELAIAGVIDAWCAGKPMVNPLVYKVKEEILGRTLHPRHRLFLTYLDDVLQNVILISPLGPAYKGYLMDLEFYGKDMPLGGLEFAVVKIIEQLVAEGHELLSLGGTYGCRIESCTQSDPEIDQVLEDLHSQGIFNDDGNLQFKNKFRPENRAIYLCRPAGSGKSASIVDIIMMIADPEAMQTPDVEHHNHPGNHDRRHAGEPVRTAVPVAARQARAAAPQLAAPGDATVERRLEALRQVGFNPQNLPFEHVEFDLKTDSWAQLSSPAIEAQISHLRSQLQVAASVDESLRGIFPFAHFVLTSSGRMAEQVFYKALPRKGTVLQNILFPTGLFHQIDNQFEPVEVPCPEALQPESSDVFKGDVAWDTLRQQVQDDPQSVALVCIELGNNATGGLPVSLQRLRALKPCLAQHGIMLVLDATRVLENARFVIEHEPAASEGDMLAVAREMLSYADVVICSLAKDFGLDRGGLVATNDPALFQRMSELALESGCALDAIDRKLVALALRDRKRVESQVMRRMESVRLMWAAFHERGIPVAQPAGGHCILFNVNRMSEFQALEDPVASFVTWLYLNTGIRIGAHSVGMQAGTPINGLARLAVPLGLKGVQMEQIIARVVDAFGKMENLPDVAPLDPGKRGDLHAHYGLRSLDRPTAAAARPPLADAPEANHVPAATPAAVAAPAGAPARDAVAGDAGGAPGGAQEVGAQAGRERGEYALCDIAVVGMAGRYPRARSLNELGTNLAAGTDCIDELPAERLARRALQGPALNYRGGFIADVERFDALFFNISPREAELMDPQERLFLEVAWEAMEDAGYSPETLVREDAPRNIGVFVGAVWAMYQMVGLEQRQAGNPLSPNSFLWTIANRVSYVLNLCGPSLAVDTACSSSLTALYLACESIYKGECSAAIVGGVNLDLHQGKLDINQIGGALSPDGVCRTFGKGANGYVAGEGVGAILVKPLADAVRDGDDIYGVIKGAAVNHGGRSSGYAVPNPNSQADVISTALARAGVDARTLGYVEAHGTGTELGDPVEIRGLSKAFEKFGVDPQSCAIGSVKTNIGHLEAAAGIVGVCKVLLQMRRGQLFPSLYSREPNEFIDFEHSPFYVVQALEPWEPKTLEGVRQPLRAGVSSFGAGGANAHVILESHERAPLGAGKAQRHARVFPISARTEEQLREVAVRLRDHLRAVPESPGSVAFTLQVGRRAFEYRAAILATTIEELTARLEHLIRGASDEHVIVGSAGNATGIGKLLTRKEQDEFAQIVAKGGDLRRLAQLWVDGMLADWSGISGGKEDGPRTHLPTYPFGGRRHWAGGRSQAVSRTQSALHPMIDTNESTFERQIFGKRYHDRDFFIYDHLVSEIPTLPGVAYLELVRKAGELAAGRKVERIRNIVWLSPIVVHGAAERHVKIELKPKGEVVHFEVFTQETPEQRTLHAQGQLLYSPADERHPETIDLAAIRNRCTKVISGQDAYPRFKALGLGLGPSFQVLGEIHKGDGETLGRLRLPEARIGDLGELLLHPALVDGSLQVGVAAQLDDPAGEMAVPYSIGEVELLHPLPPECWSYVVKDTSHTGSRVSRANVTIVDEHGKVLLRIRETVGVPLTEVHKVGDVPRSGAAPQVQDGGAMLHYIHEWTGTPLPAAPAAPQGDGAVLLFSSAPALLGEYRDSLRAAGAVEQRPVLVVPGTDFAELDDGYYRINPSLPADFVRLLDALERKGLAVRQACLAWPLGEQADAGLEAALEQGAYALLWLCQALAGRKQQDNVRLLYLFQSDGPAASPHHEAVNGFAAALRLEHPKLQCKTVELRGSARQRVAEIMLAELGPDADPVKAVRYDDLNRASRRLCPVELPVAGAPVESGVSLRERGVYLITGGAGGLGLLFAEFLARNYKARLVLTGRSALTAEQQSRLAGVEQAGAEVCYLRADAADRDQLAHALAQARQRFGVINGVIHSAGVLRDSYIRNKTRAEMAAVIAPKALGALALDALTQQDELDFFVLFSSMSAVGGNPGQCDYCFANHYLDSFAIQREALRATGARKGKTLSINWSLWQNGGMKLDEQSERLFRKATGLVPLRDEDGTRAFVQALGSPYPQVVAASGSRETIEAVWGLRPTPAAAIIVTDPKPSSQAASEAAPGSGAELVSMLRRELSQIAMGFLKLDASEIRSDKILLDLGFDSVGLATFANMVNDKFALDITPILFFDYPSIDEIAKHLATARRAELERFVPSAAGTLERAAPAAAQASQPAPVAIAQAAKGWKSPDPAPARLPIASFDAKAAAQTRFSSEPIAIIGMSGVMPQSDDLHAFWEQLREGKSLVTQVPPDRWRWEEYFGDPRKEPGKTNSRWGGFMNEVDKFDPLFFGISPREAQMMDPQQRIFLETVWAAIEDSGHKVSDFANTRTGVFVGAATNDYIDLGNRQDVPIDAYTASGNSHSVLANRVSFLLNLRGPSAPIDTACSSSLIALHRAIESIHTGSSDMAIVGGVQVMLTPVAHISFSMAGMLSDDGKCKTFDKRANGYVRGEGAGAIVIKPLAKAVADGDHIYAVVRSTAENHGGRVTTLTAPNASAQTELLVEAYTKAQIDPSTVGYIECHGTGTSLGDPIEVQALSRAFSELYQRHGIVPSAPHCGLSSVKTNIGHLETAAGIAGILKSLLALKNRQIPANAHFEELNPYINLKGTPFYIVQDTVDWEAPRDAEGRALPRRAGVSSFGFGGANAHVVLEEYIEPFTTTAGSTGGRVLIVLSAKNEERLQAYARKLLAHVERAPVDLERLAYTLQVGRDAFAERLAFVASNVDELKAKLAAFVAEPSQAHAVYHHRVRGQAAGRETDRRAGAETIQALVERGALEAVAERWAEGDEIDWMLLYPEGAPRRCAVPTYPFARERCWMPATASARAAVAAQSAAAPAVLHPLVQRNTSTLREQKFATRLDGDEFFLSDHVVESQRVLPGVAYMEMGRAAGQFAAEREVRFIRNLVWLTPLIVGPGGAEIEIALAPHAQQLEFSVNSHADGRTITYCKGQIGFGAAPQPPERIDIARLREECGEQLLSGAELYAYFAASGLELGPGFQIVQQVWGNGKEALALLELPDHIAESAGRFVLHPALMDGALHAAIGLMKKAGVEQPLSLPFSVRELEIFGSVQDVRYSHVTWSAGDGGDGSRQLKVDFQLLDRDGRVLVRIKEFLSRPLRREGTASSSQVRITTARPESPGAGLHTLLPVWQLAAPDPQRHERGTATHVALVGGNAEQLRWLRASCPDAYALELEPSASPEQIAARLREASFDELVWMAPDLGPHEDAGAASGNAVIEAQGDGVLAVFRIAKALLIAGYGARPVRWTLMTARTQTVRGIDWTVAVHASVAGLAGSLAKEYANWNLRLLDVESLTVLSARDCLAAPLVASGKSVAYRRGEWFVQELAVAESLPVPPAAYRQGGVYVVIGGAGGLGEVWSRYLIERYQARIVWIGRRPRDAGIEARIDALARAGQAPLYFSADATDVQALERVREEIRKVYPAIHGVLHSALVLRDQAVATMDMEAFRASLDAKVGTSVNLDLVFGGLDLDFMLFFSSIVAFDGAAGQSNYAAGCAFKDAFARQLRERRPYPVKTINWGYWGNVGVVADAAHMRAMEQMGIGSIEPDEGMAQLELLLGSHLDQLAVLKTVGTQALASLQALDVVTCRHEGELPCAPDLEATAEARCSADKLAALQAELPSGEQEALVTELLAAVLTEAGMLYPDAREAALPAHHGRWLAGSRRYLEAKGWWNESGGTTAAPRALTALWMEWEERRPRWISARPQHEAQTRLIESCLKALPDILQGKQLATEILFPRSSMHLVEGVYRGNPLADHFNGVLGHTLTTCIEQWRRAKQCQRIRILEIGAGTGGTTSTLLPLLDRFGDAVVEYCYTDVSKAFLMHAEKHFKPHFPVMTTALFDVTKPLANQPIEAGHYDIVVAANVLHATPNIRATIRNAKAALKRHGVLLLNEISTWSVFSHLTFGLLEGWWAAEDAPVRLADCPGLAPHIWEELLSEEGFATVGFPARDAHALGQQIIAASSDGMVRQPRKGVPVRTEAVTAVQAAPVTRQESPAVATKKPYSEVNRHMVREYIEKLLAQKLSDALQLPQARIRNDEPFAEYGVDSIVGVNLVRTISEALEIELDTTSLFQYSTIDALADHILSNWERQITQRISALRGSSAGDNVPQQGAPVRSAPLAEPVLGHRFAAAVAERAEEPTPLPAAREERRDAIAIVGMSGRFAGSESLKQFWTHLSAGDELLLEVTRWKPEESVLSAADPGSYCRHGGFIDSIDLFDAAFFRISPREAANMDPQQRIFLEESWKALEDAGYANKEHAERRCGVFVGCGASQYETLLGNDAPAQAFWGNDQSIVPARIAYLLDLQGPAISVNTACSSSLVAIHLACQSLATGETDMALAGGVFLQPQPGFHQVANRAGLLSPSGRCFVFDARADGFVPGEGAGVVVLKRLGDALRDRDHIHAVIRGSGINQDGSSNGIIAPNAAAQERLERDVYERFGIDPESIQMLEAHGTGTLMGDAIEFGAITRAFRHFTDKRRFCAIGSAKANIGHASTAAGAAGVLKAVLALQNCQIPPSANFDQANPGIDLDNSPFYVTGQPRPWERSSGSVRRAAVSSFGFSGTNAHLIVEEAPECTRPAPNLPGYLIALSARTAEQLRQQVRNLLGFLQETPAVAMHDLSYTLIVGRAQLAMRLACAVRDAAGLAGLLQEWLETGNAQGVFMSPAGDEPPCERVALKKFGNFCIEQLRDSEGEEALEHLATIADLYAQGYALDYASVIPKGQAGRIPLPTYPFARERHWIEALPQAPVYPVPQQPEHGMAAATTAAARDAVPSARQPASDEERVIRFLQLAAAEELQLASTAVEPDLSYFDLGFTSMGVANLVRKTNEALAIRMAPSILFEHPTIRKLAAWLVSTHAEQVRALALPAMPGVARVPSEATAQQGEAGRAQQDPVVADASATTAALLERIAVAEDDKHMSDYEKLTF